MRILIAPNAFKHSLDAMTAAKAIQRGLMKSRLSASCTCFPVGDGGDGTGALIIEPCNGLTVRALSEDALGKNIVADFGLIDNGNTAVIEMANASGIRLLTSHELNPLIANSYGTGLQLKQALDKGVRKIVIGMGGSATVDGATGILQALGIRFLDAQGRELTQLPKDLDKLYSIDVSGLDERATLCEWIVLCDVENPLIGDNGAAAIFGPQKGATPPQVAYLDECLARLANVIEKLNGKQIAAMPRAGTAGGAAGGLHGLLHAQLVNGFDYFLELTGFDKAIAEADLVITGEGSIDEQTLLGKGPYGVALAARKKNNPVIAFAGKLPSQPSEALQAAFDELIGINPPGTDLETAISKAEFFLEKAAMELGNRLAAGQGAFNAKSL